MSVDNRVLVPKQKQRHRDAGPISEGAVWLDTPCCRMSEPEREEKRGRGRGLQLERIESGVSRAHCCDCHDPTPPRWDPRVLLCSLGRIWETLRQSLLGVTEEQQKKNAPVHERTASGEWRVASGEWRVARKGNTATKAAYRSSWCSLSCGNFVVHINACRQTPQIKFITLSLSFRLLWASFG